MVQEETSFLTDIKKYEDMLAKDPNSFCFAPLAELYRKVGLLDDAIDVARKGCEQHQDYVGGLMALGRAFFEKGLKNESKEALERVVAVTPDNHLAQKLLSQIYVDMGENVLAEKALRSLLAINPDDLESRLLLNSLRGAGDASVLPDDVLSPDLPENSLADDAFLEMDDDSLFDEVEIVEDLTDEFLEEEEIFPPDISSENADFFATDIQEKHQSPLAKESPAKDPLTTATLAELYISQGFIPSALKIYQELLEAEPINQEYLKRCNELQALLAASENSVSTGAVMSDATAGVSSYACLPTPPCLDSLPHAVEDHNVVAHLETWLDNINRRRDVV